MSDELCITEKMILSMKKASSWIRFLAICGFVYVGLVVASGVLFANVFSLVGFVDSSGISAADLGVNPFLLSLIIMIVFVAIGIVIIIPFRYLYNFGTKMRTYVQTNNENALELAFKNNKSFWKFYGILTIIYLALIPVALIIAGVFYV
jgi:hypothetical protein